MKVECQPFLEVFKDASGGNIKTLQSEYLDHGDLPIVDQGKQQIGGYTNDLVRRCKAELPVVVFGDHTKTIKYVDFPFAIGADGTKVLVPRGNADVKYLYYALQLVNIPAAGYSRHFKFLKEAKIPIPPLPEQKRIAAILDAADALRAKRRESIEQLDQLLQSTFLEMFGDPVTNPKNMPKVALGDLIRVSSGNGLTAKEMDSSGKFPVYGGNGINGYHSESMFEYPQIVIGRVGVYCGAVHMTLPNSWVTDNALYVREYKRPVNQVFLEWSLRFARLNQYASTSAQPLISGSRIYPLRIVLPDDELQHRFESITHVIHKQLALLRAHLTELDQLFASLQQRAFSGEL